jgi:hypothetical protein
MNSVSSASSVSSLEIGAGQDQSGYAVDQFPLIEIDDQAQGDIG